MACKLWYGVHFLREVCYSLIYIMQSRGLEKTLVWIARIAIYLLPLTLLIVSKSAFFPFITTKNFLFRGIVEIAAAAWVGLLIINFRHYWPKRSLVLIAFFSLIGAAFLATIFSTNSSYSFWSNFERMEGFISYIHLLLLFLVCVGVFQRRKDWFIFFGISIAVSVIMASYGILEYAGVITTFSDSSRIIATLGNPLYVAAYLTFHIFLLAFLFFYVRNKYVRGLFGGLIILELTAFFLTGSRGAFIGIVGGLGAMLFLALFVAKEKKKKLIVGGALFLLMLVPLGLHFLQDVSFIKNNDVLSRFSNISIADTTASSRFIIWNMAFQSFLERPLLGWGLNNFIIPFAKNYDPRLFGNEPWFDRTHSMPFEWLVSAGIIGFGAYLFLIAAILFSLWKAAKKGMIQPRDALIFFGMIIAYFFQMLFVFDVLATHMMLIAIVAFLAVATSASRDVWEKKIQQIGGRSISGGHITGVVAVFLLSLIFVYAINMRSHGASSSLIDAFRAVGEGKNDVALQSFDRALSLSHGAIGESEVREQLVRIVSDGLLGNPQLVQNQQIRALTERAKEEIEKEVAGYGDEYPNTRFSIMLGRFYGIYSGATGDPSFLEASSKTYADAISFAPNYIPLYPFVANYYVQLGEYDTALDLVKEAQKKLALADKFSPEIAYNIPLIYLIAGRYDEALSAMKELQISLGGNLAGLDSSSLNTIVRVLQRNNSLENREFIEDLYTMDPRLVQVGMLLANLYAEGGRYNDARRVAQSLVAVDPSLAEEINAFLASLGSLE